jgi:hypothetical protein
MSAISSNPRADGNGISLRLLEFGEGWNLMNGVMFLIVPDVVFWIPPDISKSLSSADGSSI